MRTYKQFRDRGVFFVGLSPEGASDLEDMQKFVRETEIPWPNGYGANYTMDRLGVRGLPTIYVINRQGNIVWSGHDSDDVAKVLEAVL